MAELVKAPNGEIFDMEGAPPEVRQRMHAEFQKQGRLEEFKTGAKEVVGAVGGGLADLGRGAIRGLETAWQGMETGSPVVRLGRMVAEGQGLPAPKGTAERVLPTPEGDPTWRKYLRGGLEGLGGVTTTGPTNVIGAVSGVSAGVAEQGAKEYAPNNPLAQLGASVLGGMAGGTVAGFATRIRPQSAAIAKEALEGISEGDLAVAQRYMQQVAANGTPVDLAQALVATKGNAGNLESIRDTLARHSQGNQVQARLRAQPEQLKIEADMTLADLPGTNWSQTQNASNTQEAASLAIKAAKDVRSGSVRELYAAAGDLPPQARTELGKVLNQYATQPGATDVMKTRAKELAQKLLGNDPKLSQAVAAAQSELTAATTIPAKQAARAKLAAANAAVTDAKTTPLRALDVDTWISELRGPFQGGMPLKVSHPKEQGQIKGLAGALNKVFQELSPEVKKAEGKFREITEGVVNPLMQGPVGTLAGRGYDPATKAAVSNFDTLLNRGTETSAKISDIRTAAAKLGEKNPEAFEDSFKGWLGRQMEGASTSASQGRPLGEVDPKKLSAAIFDKPNIWQGIKDAAATMADVRGVDRTSYLRGLENLKQLTKAMASNAKATGMSPEDLKRLGGSSATADLIRVASFLPLNKAGERIERATLGKTLSQFDTILTSPEGAKMLVELGKVPVMSKKAQVILGTFGGIVGNPPELLNSNPKEK